MVEEGIALPCASNTVRGFPSLFETARQAHGEPLDFIGAVGNGDVRFGKVHTKGRLDPKASTATGYAWIVWEKSAAPIGRPELVWIPPCRKRLEEPGDYDVGECSPTIQKRVDAPFGLFR